MRDLSNDETATIAGGARRLIDKRSQMFDAAAIADAALTVQP